MCIFPVELFSRLCYNYNGKFFDPAKYPGKEYIMSAVAAFLKKKNIDIMKIDEDVECTNRQVG